MDGCWGVGGTNDIWGGAGNMGPPAALGGAPAALRAGGPAAGC